MKDLQLYQELLGLCAPWRVTDAQMNLPAQEITVTVASSGFAWEMDRPMAWEPASI